MVDTIAESDRSTDAALADLSPRARAWTLTIACFGVLLVISSMVALPV